MDRERFDTLIGRVAGAWARQDAGAAADCFAEDATYMEPPDVQLFVGREQLRSYFSPLEPGTYLDIHNSWFDPTRQAGAIEFSFGVRGRHVADHGVAVVEVSGDVIATWREYHVRGPGSFGSFIATDAKTWKWHIGNYP